MYSVIIVDDEEILREGLVNLVDWKTMGFEVAGQFEDGQDAVEFLKRCPVDVVLTDVKMTYMSGLDLSEYIVENRLPAKIVLISGYKEFDDAYRAVQLNITEFLLKPVSLDDIRQVFSRVGAFWTRQGGRSRNSRRWRKARPSGGLYHQAVCDQSGAGRIPDRGGVARSLETLGLRLGPAAAVPWSQSCWKAFICLTRMSGNMGEDARTLRCAIFFAAGRGGPFLLPELWDGRAYTSACGLSYGGG